MADLSAAKEIDGTGGGATISRWQGSVRRRNAVWLA
jgi:hypothetical protein